MTIRDFEVSTTKKSLTAWVDEVGARIPVLNLKLHGRGQGHRQAPDGQEAVTATLQKGAAQALNGYFSATGSLA